MGYRGKVTSNVLPLLHEGDVVGKAFLHERDGNLYADVVMDDGFDLPVSTTDLSINLTLSDTEEYCEGAFDTPVGMTSMCEKCGLMLSEHDWSTLI